jgi:hypothetical protein
MQPESRRLDAKPSFTHYDAGRARVWGNTEANHYSTAFNGYVQGPSRSIVWVNHQLVLPAIRENLDYSGSSRTEVQHTIFNVNDISFGRWICKWFRIGIEGDLQRHKPYLEGRQYKDRSARVMQLRV